MRVRTAFLCACVSLAVCSPFVASAEAPANCPVFTRNLKMGMTGSDVKALQVFLNANAKTPIALSGLGSPGNESTYFGKKTMLALASFQELYASEVLTPAGLTRGSGFFGALSRGKVALLCANALHQSKAVSAPKVPLIPPVKPATSPVQSQDLTPQPSASALSFGVGALKGQTGLSSLSSGVDVPVPYISYPESYSVPQGGTLVIFGGGFTKTGNTVLLGNTPNGGLSSESGGDIRMTIPLNSPTGKFSVKVQNSKGTSNESFVVVTLPKALAPVITSVTPKTVVNIGGTVTVFGEHFSKNGNKVVIGQTTVTGTASSDGRSLSFIAQSPAPDEEEILPEERIVDDIYFYVITENGVSNEGVFKMRF